MLTGVTVQQIVSAARYRVAIQRIETLVTALQASRAVAVPLVIRNLQEFPRELVVEELTTLFDDSEQLEKLPLAYALAVYGNVELELLLQFFVLQCRRELLLAELPCLEDSL